jgi:hypothetical protein
MGHIRESKPRDVHRPYNKAALKCLLEYDEPGVDDIKLEMCYNNLCPKDQCEFPGGRSNGGSCGHVIAVKLLTSKLKHVLMGN